MRILPINSINFGAKLEMSQDYEGRLRRDRISQVLYEKSQKSINDAIERIEQFPADDTYRLENVFNYSVRLSSKKMLRKISPYSVVYKNGEKLGIFPGEEERFIKHFAKSFELREKYDDAFKKLNMNESDIIRTCNEIPLSSEEELAAALDKIQKSKKDKKYSVCSERKSIDIFADRDNVLLNQKGRIIKKKECAMADFIVYVAKRYFRR